jgi:branched-chain amino acid transport system permease protein
MKPFLARHGGLAVLALLLLAFPLLRPDSFAYDVAIRIGLNAVVVIGLNLLFGYAGQISLGHAAFFGMGAYASAILTTHFDWPPVAALAAGAAATGLLAYVIARPILRLSGHHLAMATLSLGLIATIVFNNETRWTGGSDGMSVPPLWYVLVAVLVFLATWAASNLVDSPAGRALQAIRGSEVAARVAGIDTARFKTRVFVLSAVLASLMGSLTAHYAGFLTPAAAGLTKSVEFVMMVVLGGTASVFGSLVGAGLITLLPQFLQAFESWETLVLGLILTAAMIFLRAGIVPSLRAAFAGRRG